MAYINGNNVPVAINIVGKTHAGGVSYENKNSGLASTNVQDAIDEIALKIGGHQSIVSWGDVQQIVRAGLAPQIFKIGEQLECTRNGVTLLWDIIGFDHDIPTDGQYEHSMTIQLHDCITSIQFAAKEAMFYAADGLTAGTYNFQVVTNPWNSSDNGKTFQFTLTKAVPAEGQIFLDIEQYKSIAGKKVKTYASPTSTDVIETAIVSQGNDGTALGKIDGSVTNLNHIQRIMHGSNRYETSAVRQWLNSSKDENNWWTSQTVYDRPPSELGIENGFLHNLDPDFLAVVGQVKKRTALNDVTYSGGHIDSDELFFLVSRSEVYGGLENDVNEGEPYPYYSDYSNLSAPGTGNDSNRIKFNTGTLLRWMLRSPCVDQAHGIYSVYGQGNIHPSSANVSIDIAPACNIV